jgi:two-component system sensor histidine kinase TctE
MDANPPREQRSLFGEILDWMLAPLLLLWPMSVALTWLVAQSIANRPYDRDLAETGAHRGAPGGGGAGQRGAAQPHQVGLPEVATEVLRADDDDKVYFQVLGSARRVHRR